jgi:DNA-binding beta-propeller fold protein YncE
MTRTPKLLTILALTAGVGLVVTSAGIGVQAQQGAPRYRYDPEWPKTLPNKWKMGGVTGLAVDRNDDVWVHNRPNDLTNIELQAELTPPISDCCTRPPSMIHISKTGDVIGSFDAPQGHGMDVDSKGFIYLGQNTVRKYDPKTGQIVGAIARVPEMENGNPAVVPQLPKRVPGQGGQGPVAGFLPDPPGSGPSPEAQAKQAAQRMAFRKKYPPETPMIVGGLEEIRIDEPANEIYVADNYLGGRVLVFDLNTFAFKRGWGAYGKPLKDISIDDSTRGYKPSGPMAKDFVGHLTLNFSNDGLVYAADRVGNRIHVTDKQGKFLKEFPLATYTGVGGAPGGVAFSPDKEQRYLFISDLTNNHIWFLNRADGKVVGQLGGMAETGGNFFGLHMIAVDSRGTIYTGEVFAGERVQRFVPADSPRGKVLEQLSKTPLF